MELTTGQQETLVQVLCEVYDISENLASRVVADEVPDNYSELVIADDSLGNVFEEDVLCSLSS